MWVAEGLTHRYPTKVLAELLPTCPQYCGHCTRMDLVGNSTPVIDKLKFDLKPVDRLGRDDRLPAPLPRRARRRRVRRRRRQHAVQEPRGVRRPAARHREHPRHPAGHQGADGPAAALAAGRRPRRHGAAGDGRARPRRAPGDPHPRQQRRVGHPAGGRRDQGDARGRRARRAQPGRAHARRQRHDDRPARPVLRAARRRRDHALLLLHVRHDPVLGALAGLGPGGPAAAARDHGLPAGLRDAADRLRRAVRRASAGCTRSRSTTSERGISYWTKNYRTGIENDRPRRAEPARTSTTTRSTPCPRPARHGGASTARRLDHGAAADRAAASRAAAADQARVAPLG